MENLYTPPQLITLILKQFKQHIPEIFCPVIFIWLLTFTKYRHIKQILLSSVEDGKDGKEKDDTIMFQNDDEISYRVEDCYLS